MVKKITDWPVEDTLGYYASTDNEAFKSICRLLGLRANNPTLGVQHAICLHLFKNFYQWFSHPSEHTKNHATSHANKNNTKKTRI